MSRKSLEISQALGDKEAMASAYGNRGNVYSTREDLDRAEAMYRKALEINPLGYKAGRANAYANLGIAYQIRGDLDGTKTLYRKALALFKEIGAEPQAAQVRAWLTDLPK